MKSKNGGLNLFRKALKEQSEIREPYKTRSKNSNGKYKTTAEPKSSEKRKSIAEEKQVHNKVLS